MCGGGRGGRLKPVLRKHSRGMIAFVVRNVAIKEAEFAVSLKLESVVLFLFENCSIYKVMMSARQSSFLSMFESRLYSLAASVMDAASQYNSKNCLCFILGRPKSCLQ